MHRKGEGITIMPKFFVSQDRNETLCKGKPSVFQKYSGIEKNLWIEGRISRFSVKIFMSHSAEKFRKGILLFLRKFLVSKSFVEENEGGYHVFRRKFQVSQCRKLSWASLQSFREFGVSKNLLRYRECHVFPSESFCLTIAKYFIGQHFGV